MSLQTPDIKEVLQNPRLYCRLGVRQKVRSAHKIIAEYILEEILFGKPDAIYTYVCHRRGAGGSIIDGSDRHLCCTRFAVRPLPEKRPSMHLWCQGE